MEPARLDDRAVLALAGPEARSFLQGLITNDVENLSPGLGLYTALLSAQGKILFDFFVTEGDGALLLDCPAPLSESLLRKLKMYRLRARVEIEQRAQLAVFVNLRGHPDNRPTSYADRAVSFPDPRLAALGIRSIGAVAEMPANLTGASAYHAQRLALGVPEGSDFGSEKIFALDAGLEELNGVSFKKGCYIGQELTSRMKHRATARKRILRITAEAALPPVGSVVEADGLELGEILAVTGHEGLALVRLDRLDEAKGQPFAAQIPVALTRPAWLQSAHGA